MTTQTQTAIAAPAFRVRFVIDEDARFEECNGESRPLTAEGYAENSYRGCPIHPRSKVAPRRVKNGHAWCGECGTKYADLPYEEYLAYYGNPERHVYLGCIVDKRCACCGQWEKDAASVWSVELMDDDPAFRRIDLSHNGGYVMTPDAALNLPGYLAEIAREELDEAGYVR